MSVSLTINGHSTTDTGGQSIFDCAEALGVQVPTSCQKNGKCKECIVEVTDGLYLLSAPNEAESHLKGNFRLSCQCSIVADDGEVKCHTMRRGQMRIEFRDRVVELAEGEMLVVPRGVEHRTVAENEVEVLLFEPAATRNDRSSCLSMSRAAPTGAKVRPRRPQVSRQAQEREVAICPLRRLARVKG